VVAFDEASHQTQTVDFDFAAVDRDLDLSDEIPPGLRAIPLADANERTVTVMSRMLEWLCQMVPKNQSGMEIRATILCWIFLPHLRSLSLTQVAAMIGRDKQSLGRWVDDFKRTFPGVHHFTQPENPEPHKAPQNHDKRTHQTGLDRTPLAGPGN
jgi:hypothetical protein